MRQKICQKNSSKNSSKIFVKKYTQSIPIPQGASKNLKNVKSTDSGKSSQKRTGNLGF